ncbi:MAG: hypothetical protein HFG69_07305 [Hungatella sp.]|nr:hypothetical protein [Hungatella sp.]
MNIKFDAVAAERLIRQMDKYCFGIQKEAKDLLAVIKSPGDWQDNQMKAFQTNINEIAKDLNQALALESEYMRIFDQRVKELKG